MGKCVCSKIIRDKTQLAVTLLRQGREGGHLEACTDTNNNNRTLDEHMRLLREVATAARSYRQAEKDLQDRVLTGKFYQGDGFADEVEATMRELDAALKKLNL